MSYTKLFSSLTASTIWNAPDHTRLVWITMLAMADRDGYVGASVPGLAVLARVPIESVIIALESFSSPDEWSRTKDNEGRRIEERDGGWLLLNYHKYRTTDDIDHVREKTAERTRRYRENKRRHGDATVTPVTPVTKNHPIAAPEETPTPETAAFVPVVTEPPTAEELKSQIKTLAQAKAMVDPAADAQRVCKQLLMAYPEARGLPGEPDAVIVGKCLTLASGSPEALGVALRSMFLADKKPETSWAWFPVVLAQYLQPRRVIQRERRA